LSYAITYVSKNCEHH